MTIDALPNIPCQDCPSGSSDVVWRYNSNPIIPRDLIPSSNIIFNSAVVPYNGKFAGVFRCDNKKREKNLNRGVGDDGVQWKPDNDPFCWECDDPGINWFQTATPSPGATATTVTRLDEVLDFLKQTWRFKNV